MSGLIVKGLAVGLVIGLVAGLVMGYFFVVVLALQVAQLEAEIMERDAKISDLSTQPSGRSEEVAALQKRAEELETKIEESEKPEDVSPTAPSSPISSKYPAKRVTWADGTTETIQVDDKGRIYLNGEEVKAFGFCIGRIEKYGIPTDEMVDRMLDWLQDKGVRFMSLGIGESELEWAEYIEFYMRHLYAHKMFVHVVFGQGVDPDNIDVTTQYDFFKAGVDKINELPQAWVDSIYAVNLPCWELNIWYDPAQLEPYLGNIFALCRDYLYASKIGRVPLNGKTAHEMWDDGGIVIVKHSDMPCWDFYPRDEHWKRIVDRSMKRIRDEVLSTANKTGYQIWLTEHGYGKVIGNTWGSGNVNPGYPPELLDYLLSDVCPEISSISIWILQYFDDDNRNDWGAFYQGSGDPKQWIINLAPHFPNCETLPVADAGPDQTVVEDTLVTFDGSGSSDNVGITSYTWTFVDATPQTLTGINPTYNFSTPGSYPVALKITDVAGNYATDTVTVTVLDVTKPVADVDDTVDVGTAVVFNAKGSSDNVAIISYEWDFGDGTTGTGITTVHTYTEPGTYTVTLTVKDAAGNSDTDTVVVTVSSDPFPWWIVGVMVSTLVAFVVLVLLGAQKRQGLVFVSPG